MAYALKIYDIKDGNDIIPVLCSNNFLLLSTNPMKRPRTTSPDTLDFPTLSLALSSEPFGCYVNI